MLNILVSLLPIVLYLLVLQIFDVFSMARWRKLAGSLLWGMASACITYGIVYLYRRYVNAVGWHGVWISPLIEEVLKAMPLCVLILRRRVVFFAETQIYGQMVGGGFALVENLMYAFMQPQMLLGTAVVRGLGTGMLHMGCSATVASMVLFLKHRYWALPLALVPSLVMHIIYNIHSLDPLQQLLLVVVFFFIVFYMMAKTGERWILKWMDASIQTDIALLAALRKGELLDTHTGRYLQSIKERFDALQFFDMCVYVQLYLELLVEGKSRIMLRDAGLDMPLDPEQKILQKQRLAELDALASRISPLGHHLLRPILHSSSRNLWAIRN